MAEKNAVQRKLRIDIYHGTKPLACGRIINFKVHKLTSTIPSHEPYRKSPSTESIIHQKNLELPLWKNQESQGSEILLSAITPSIRGSTIATISTLLIFIKLQRMPFKLGACSPYTIPIWCTHKENFDLVRNEELVSNWYLIFKRACSCSFKYHTDTAHWWVSSTTEIVSLIMPLSGN